jgi:hypothetical protein
MPACRNSSTHSSGAEGREGAAARRCYRRREGLLHSRTSSWECQACQYHKCHSTGVHTSLRQQVREYACSHAVSGSSALWYAWVCSCNYTGHICRAVSTHQGQHHTACPHTHPPELGWQMQGYMCCHLFPCAGRCSWLLPHQMAQSAFAPAAAVLMPALTQAATRAAAGVCPAASQSGPT